MSDRNQAILEAISKQTKEMLTWPPEKLQEWFRRVHGPVTRILEGKEAENIYLILLLTEPYESSNNQRTETHCYRHAGREYRITYGLGDTPLVQEVLE